MKNPDDEYALSEAQRAKHRKRERFLEWCRVNDEDPESDGAWDSFIEVDSFWDDLDENNRAGWNDNMNRY
jgi:hypothetical protein